MKDSKENIAPTQDWYERKMNDRFVSNSWLLGEMVKDVAVNIDADYATSCSRLRSQILWGNMS